MEELYNLIFDTIQLPVGFEFLEPIIIIYFLSIGLIMAFSLFKCIIDKI